MSNLNLKKSDVLNAAIVVSKELSASAEAMAIKFNERLSAGMDTKKIKRIYVLRKQKALTLITTFWKRCATKSSVVFSTSQ